MSTLAFLVYLCFFSNSSQPVHPSDYAGPGFEYIMRYRTFEQRDASENFTEVPLEPDKTTYEVRAEEELQLYEVQVISQNQVGRSTKEPKSVNGTSGESVYIQHSYF